MCGKSRNMEQNSAEIEMIQLLTSPACRWGEGTRRKHNFQETNFSAKHILPFSFLFVDVFLNVVHFHTYHPLWLSLTISLSVSLVNTHTHIRFRKEFDSQIGHLNKQRRVIRSAIVTEITDEAVWCAFLWFTGNPSSDHTNTHTHAH